jgi:hypothetical protein
MLSPQQAQLKFLQNNCNSAWRSHRAALKAAKAVGLTKMERIEAMKVLEARDLEFQAASDALTAFRRCDALIYRVPVSEDNATWADRGQDPEAASRKQP